VPPTCCDCTANRNGVGVVFGELCSEESDECATGFGGIRSEM